jgi:hypothetical protein
MARSVEGIEELAYRIAKRVESGTGIRVEVVFHDKFVEFSAPLRVEEREGLVNLDDEENARRMEAVEYAAALFARAAGGQFDADTDCDLEVAREGDGRARADYCCLVYVPPEG